MSIFVLQATPAVLHWCLAASFTHTFVLHRVGTIKGVIRALLVRDTDLQAVVFCLNGRTGTSGTLLYLR